MARSLQQIMDSADEIADQAERGTGDGELLEDGDDPWLELKLAAFNRAQAEKQLVAAVSAARARDLSWGEIAKHLGLTGEAVRRRYGDLVGPRTDELEKSVLRSVGPVPEGGRIRVEHFSTGRLIVKVLNRQSQPIRRVRKAEVAELIAGRSSLVIRGRDVPVERV